MWILFFFVVVIAFCNPCPSSACNSILHHVTREFRFVPRHRRVVIGSTTCGAISKMEKELSAAEHPVLWRMAHSIRLCSVFFSNQKTTPCPFNLAFTFYTRRADE